MIRSLLIANRGEIACRIIRATKKLDIQSIAVYSTCDAQAQHVQQADVAYHIGDSPASASYLNIDALLQAAKESNAEAIHPGYGFLSESAEFAHRCKEAGFIFIGPNADVIALMGDKRAAKKNAESLGIPIASDYRETIPEDSLSRQSIATQIGLPILVKASAGGGGKGMRLVEKLSDLDQAITEAAREAKAAFSNDTLMFEKYIANARHIEVQIAGDQHGEVIHLFDRDCSAQRRHQKIIEEAPAFCEPSLRKKLFADSLALAKAIGYHTLGTVEFLVDDAGNYYFMEMNTRLQVEHPVTEMITGIDCVALQIRLACGEAMPYQQKEIRESGHAIELRLCAEDPQNSFLPSIGVLSQFETPVTSAKLRIDTGFVAGDDISPYYDSMLAKLIVHEPTRKETISSLLQALSGLRIHGPKSNTDYLATLIQHMTFQAGCYTTHMVADTLPVQLEKLASIPPEAQLIALCIHCFKPFDSEPYSPWLTQDAWRLEGSRSQSLGMLINDLPITMPLQAMGENSFETLIDDERIPFKFTWVTGTKLLIEQENKHIDIDIAYFGLDACFGYQGRQYCLSPYRSSFEDSSSGQHENQLTSPMPGTVVSVDVAPGDDVQAGDLLMTIEAMKMEYPIKSPINATIEHVHGQVGASVREGQILIKLET